MPSPQIGRDLVSLAGRESLPTRDVLVFTRPEAPAARVLLLRPCGRVMESGGPIEAVLGAIRGVMVERDATSAAGQQLPLFKAAETVRVEGAEIPLGDVRLRPARVMRAAGAELLGIIVEVEFGPLRSLATPGAALAWRDMMGVVGAATREAGLPGAFEALEDVPYEEYGLTGCGEAAEGEEGGGDAAPPPPFGALHSAVQFAEARQRLQQPRPGY